MTRYICTACRSPALRALGGRVFRCMKAIPTAELCVTCHGSNLDPAIAATLAEFYPADRATRFAVGDIRGAFDRTAAVDQLADQPHELDLTPERPIEADGGPAQLRHLRGQDRPHALAGGASPLGGQGHTLADQVRPLGPASRLHLVRQPHRGSSSRTAFSTTALLRASSRAENSRVTGPAWTSLRSSASGTAAVPRSSSR